MLQPTLVSTGLAENFDMLLKCVKWVVLSCGLEFLFDDKDAIHQELKDLNRSQTKPEAHGSSHLRFDFVYITALYLCFKSYLWEEATERWLHQISFGNPDSRWKTYV